MFQRNNFILESDHSLVFTTQIPFWYDTVLVERFGNFRLFHELILDIVDRVAVKAFRDFADVRNSPANPENNGRDDGMISLVLVYFSYLLICKSHFPLRMKFNMQN
jgi:hypothetical protein